MYRKPEIEKLGEYLMNKISLYKQLISNMGVRYILFRSFYELKRKLGILKRNFPINPESVPILTLSEWKTSAQPFFFSSRETISFEKNTDIQLKEAFENILNGKIQFFSYQYFDLGTDYDWLSNTNSGFKYDIKKHWTEINDYSKEAGDIKYVWEKSRFSFLYTVIRYDYHFEDDHSQFVFQQITDWIEKNPLNCGPNYKCSQEISLRLLNWIFALYFYKHSIHLTEELFQKIMQSIYWQLHHVYHNIHFSRIAVRNNHAITETLTLYIVSTLFPQFPNSLKWKIKGKKWFEKEINYQIYGDGTFLQFSMNYHRVVIQLLTWAIKIAEANQEQFASHVYEKSCKSVNFLYQCQEESNGYLPNYGANDGALFFPLSGNDYRDYRSQLNALHIILSGKSLYSEMYEDVFWYGNSSNLHFQPLKKQFGINRFEIGGYYLIREADTLTFVRCGNHKDRPSHADNLHLDIWYKGENILHDSGSYKYNTDNETLKYFTGTGSHNTVMLNDYDQMQKGSRFIWHCWTQCLGADLTENIDDYLFKGKISAFQYLSKDIQHQRIVRKIKGKQEWIIEDTVENKPQNLLIRQLWHTPDIKKLFFDSSHPLNIQQSDYSSYYGQKKIINKIVFIADVKEKIINTKITII